MVKIPETIHSNPNSQNAVSVLNIIAFSFIPHSYQSSDHGSTTGSGQILIISLLGHATTTVTKGCKALLNISTS
jgi:hypothetical protein